MDSETSRVFVYLQEHETATKEEICSSLGMAFNSSSERRVRRCLSEIAKEHPVLSVSSDKGYRLLMTPKDETDKHRMQRQINENIKRAREILKRNYPIYRALGGKDEL